MKGLVLIIHSKFLARLFAVLSIVIVGAVTFGIFAKVNAPARAASVIASAHTASKATIKSKPRYIHFHANFTDKALATTGLKHWTSSFTSEGTKWKYSMVGTNPSLGSATTTVPVTIVPLLLKFSNGKELRWHSTGIEYNRLAAFPKCAIQQRHNSVWRCDSARGVLEKRLNQKPQLSCPCWKPYYREDVNHKHPVG